MNVSTLHNGTFRRFLPNTLILGNTHCMEYWWDLRLWNMPADKHATVHDQYYVTVHFSRAVLQLL